VKATLFSSPFRASSSWRSDFKEVWSYLNKHYVIQEDRSSNTIISIELLPDTARRDVKRLAQAVIHFETVFDLFRPDQAGSQKFTRRNWRDHPGLGRVNLSRAQSIALVEDTHNNIPPGDNRASSTVGMLLWPQSERQPPNSLNSRQVATNYAWDLSYDSTRTLRFGALPASATLEDLLRWTDMTVSFVQKAIACPSPARLQKIAPNILGFQYFLTGELKNTRIKFIQGVPWRVDFLTNSPIVQNREAGMGYDDWIVV
jgi:hypothetical protein